MHSLDELEQSWRPLKVEHVERKIYGDGIATSLAQLRKAYDTLLTMTQGGAEDGMASSYAVYVEQYLGERAQELARLPDYEKCRVTLEATVGMASCTIALIVSQKTKRFADELLSVKIPNAGDLILNAILMYLGAFRCSFSTQLRQLPHLAALFYNDSRFLSALARLKAGAETSQCRDVERIGAETLQDVMDQHRAELDEMCAPKMWQLRHGQLDASAVAILQRSLAQGLLRTTQISKVFQPILDKDPHVDIVSGMLEQVLRWLWNGFLGIEKVSREALALLPDFVQSAIDAPADILGKELASRRPFITGRKLESLVRITRQNLIQVSNAFRRDEFRPALSLIEFRKTIQILFPETAMRSALISEINAEIN